ncbi:MAG: hypothetical protein HUU37_05400 [Bdellovibrionales bacterium]|nr:hypothetical protein [Bdellovibrionales bacterium]
MKKLALALLALAPLSALADHGGIYSCSVYVTNRGPGGEDFVDGPYLTRAVELVPNMTAVFRSGGTYRGVLRAAYGVRVTSQTIDGETLYKATLGLSWETLSGAAGELVGEFPIDAKNDTLSVAMNEFDLRKLRLSCSLTE